MRILAADDNAIEEAAALLRAGDIVAFPTDTVYGLGADATNARAIATVFAVKQRPEFHPLINLAYDAAALTGEVLFDSRAQELAAHYWPGPLTMILNKHPNAKGASITHNGLPYMSARVPNHPVVRALLKAFGGLIAAPSANKSGDLSPTTPQHVAESLGDAVPLILAGGKTALGIESTIIDLTTAQALITRQGAISRDDIERLIGAVDLQSAPHTSHYATQKPLRLNATSANDDEAFLLFGPVIGNTGGKIRLNLSEHGDVVEAAANLFDYLRQLEHADVSRIAVMPVPDHGLGVAINDRLRRGAFPQTA